MDKLWAPWRSKYIYLRKRTSCIFCGVKKDKRTDKKYILSKSRHVFSMLNIFPYNNGHIMVAPFRHVKSLEFLSKEELSDLFIMVNKMKILLDKKLHPDGYNIGVNIGKIAGAGFAGHVHVHIVPRWAGDTNFMPIIANVKIISESLDAMYLTLKDDNRK